MKLGPNGTAILTLVSCTVCVNSWIFVPTRKSVSNQKTGLTIQTLYSSTNQQRFPPKNTPRTKLPLQDSLSSSTTDESQPLTRPQRHTVTRARDLILSLVNEDLCYSSESGASAFANVCAYDCVYEDRFMPQPIVGKIAIEQHLMERARQRQSKNGNNVGFRIDKISDGNMACGFAWTWTSGQLEGLRGTTFVELNGSGEIQYVNEIPEPIFKPNDLTKELLKVVTKDAVRAQPKPYEKKTPIVASELAKYLFIDLQNSNRTESMSELLQFFDTNVFYRDFNYEKPFLGPEEVKKLVLDFDFPGIIFNPLRFDDGIDSTCFTWEVLLGEDAPDTVKGISLYELDPETRKIVYVRDIPESAIKPPILGKLARQFNPALGVFNPVPIGSRPNGM